jgi:hypothetical protein
MKLQPFQVKILRELAASPSGSITVTVLKALYESRGDGMRVNTMIRAGLVAWLRNGRRGNAYALTITLIGSERIAREPVVSANR